MKGIGQAELFRPFADAPEVVFARAASRSPLFASNSAAGGAPVVIGSAVGSGADDVAVRAQGELRERVSNILAGRLAEERREVVATYEELERAGTRAVDPLGLVSRRSEGADDEAPRRARLLWVPGQSLITGTRTLVPAGAAFLHHRPPPGCSGMLRTGSTGVSAHTSWGAAVRHGLFEVLERDLFWRSWYGAGVRTWVLEPSLAPPALQRTLTALGLEATGLLIEGPGGTACVVSCLYPPGGQGQSYGARALFADGAAPVAWAFERASYEALMVRWSLDTPAARLAWRRMSERDVPGGEPRDALEHALAAFHARGERDCLAWWLGMAVPARSRWVPPGRPLLPNPDERTLAGLLAALTGQEPVAVDTTVPEVCPEGSVVVRIVAPGAHQLPGDERRARVPPSPSGRHRPPHPLG
ncbi:YcaO-like family protein [Melittangium boletus]|uniref:YcaO domain-containing protein n=1 Tax=Melittangium boletus DSM 14713 TaxID=1294270 RepID=A0A250IRD5_9BACT|nr:YcaO-like family protein [Melittangium boletus]ATB33813.1 hypothetical protein MEBOL_007311 [Melittangium boletus DSM 14713]